MYKIPTTIKDKELVEKRRHQLIRSGIKLFNEKGFHKTSLKEIAEVSGLSPGSIYTYISTKEDIFMLIQEALFNSAMDEIYRTIGDHKDPVERLRLMLQAEFSVMRRWGDALRILYRESHILAKDTLKRVMRKEREHLSNLESILEECIEEGVFKDFNVRLVTNFINLMIYSWIIKRWDLDGHTTFLEMERAILDIIFNGLRREKTVKRDSLSLTGRLEGKRVLLINGSTEIGMAASSFFASNGAKVAVQGPRLTQKPKQNARRAPPRHKNIKYFGTNEKAFGKLAKDFDPIDILIHDLGAPIPGKIRPKKDERPGQELENNLAYAQSISSLINQKLVVTGSGSIIYIAPCAWYKYSDPLRYEIVKSGTISLSKIMAKEMAGLKINVNCIVPGFIQIESFKDFEKEKGVEFLQDIPMGYLGDIGDVVEAVSFLVSDTSRYVTGQTISVAGGID